MAESASLESPSVSAEEALDPNILIYQEGSPDEGTGSGEGPILRVDEKEKVEFDEDIGFGLCDGDDEQALSEDQIHETDRSSDMDHVVNDLLKEWTTLYD